MIDLKKYEFLQLSFSMEDGGLVRQQNREEENIHGTSDNNQDKKNKSRPTDYIDNRLSQQGH